jgi:hypothetical protein
MEFKMLSHSEGEGRKNMAEWIDDAKDSNEWEMRWGYMSAQIWAAKKAEASQITLVVENGLAALEPDIGDDRAIAVLDALVYGEGGHAQREQDAPLGAMARIENLRPTLAMARGWVFGVIDYAKRPPRL